MPDFVSSADAVRAKLSEFTALPLFWPNDGRDATGVTAPNGFVYSALRTLDERPASLGNGGTSWRRDYLELEIFIYVPAGTLIGQAEQHAQQIRALFGVNSVNGVVVTKKQIGAGQALDMPQGKYFALPVYINFFSDRLE